MKTRMIIEKSTPADNNIKSVYETCPIMTRQNLAARFNHYFKTLKSGYGANHVWVSNLDNERLAIIYFDLK